MVGRSINLGDLMMADKRFKLSRFAIPSELSDFCDENGRMLNSEVVRMLNDRDKQQISNIHMFFKIKDQEATIEDQNKLIENLRKWLIAEQKQVEKRDDFIEQKGLMREFVKELENEYKTIYNER